MTKTVANGEWLAASVAFRRRSWLSVISLICVICGLDSGARPASSGGISPEAAESLRAKIRLLSARPPGKPGWFQPIVITDVETNSYLRYYGREFLPSGLNDPEIHIFRERIDGTANVDFDQLNQASMADDWGARMLALAFRGKQRVSASGRLETSGGQGKVTIRNVRVGSSSIPDALVSLLLASYVQKRYKIDLSKPVPLPDHVARIELGAGNATFYRGLANGRYTEQPKYQSKPELADRNPSTVPVPRIRPRCFARGFVKCFLPSERFITPSTHESTEYTDCAD